MNNESSNNVPVWRRAGVRFLLCAGLFFCLAVPPLRSHDPITTKITWTAEISRLVYKRCASCHRPGGAAFSLLTYEEARPWAKAIRDQVTARTMPPWGAVKGVGDFANDPSLSEPEIELLVAWVEGGAPEGDAVYLPAPPAAPKATAPRAFPKQQSVTALWPAPKPSQLAAIDVAGLAEGASMEAWVSRKDGSIERLLWLRDYRPKCPHVFLFRHPIGLQPGDVVHVTAPAKLLFG